MTNSKYYLRGDINPTPETELIPACKKGGCNKLNVYNWYKDIPLTGSLDDLVEVRFKNTRKAFYKNVNNLRLEPGDVIAVEASPGHDIGIVSLTGALVSYQMKKLGLNHQEVELKKVYRKARQVDIEKWKEAIDLEEATMLKARKIAEKLTLDMKIGDVEYQGDNTKAIFYYIADERVDFRELIKVLAEEFKVRIEMKQIGARQEAGRIGGIGACGRELCCSTWISNFVSVTTNAARYQEVSLNPQKLAGQCSKLKCCLNFELNCYLDAREDFPDISLPIETTDGPIYHQKTDVYRRIMWYSRHHDAAVNLIALSVDKVKDMVEQTKAGKKVSYAPEKPEVKPKQERLDYNNVVGQDSIDRFENRNKDRSSNKDRRNKNFRKHHKNH